jgi:hypothetical protein
MVPVGRTLLFPPERLAQRFGPADAAYALRVYCHHRRQLLMAGFSGATRILEIGPGRNLGSALLWWCAMRAEGRHEAQVTLWDVHPNADPAQTGFWRVLAAGLQEAVKGSGEVGIDVTLSQRRELAEVARGSLEPSVRYCVCNLEAVARDLGGQRFDLVLSHAALEHVREIDRFWRLAAQLTAQGGWHSHRIDLADHGLRETNYLEMLEWSPLAWWMTMRFIPGAINRLRASDHIAVFRGVGMTVLQAQLERSERLPVPRDWLAKPYRDMNEAELRTTAVDIVGCKALPAGAHGP